MDTKLKHEAKLCNKCYIPYLTSQKLNEEEIFDFLLSHGVLAQNISCPRCKNIVKLHRQAKVFRCFNHKKNKKRKEPCHVKKSVFSGTYFQNTKIQFHTVFKLASAILFLFPPRHIRLLEEFGIAARTLLDWQLSLREVFIDAVSENTKKLGGQGKIVELDEARSDNDDKLVAVPWEWAIGAIDHMSKETFLVMVENRNPATLRDIILQKINTGTVIVTKCLNYYNCEVFQELENYHGFKFVDPKQSAICDSINYHWSEVRRGEKSLSMRKLPNLIDHFGEYLFKSKYPDPKERIHAFFKAAGQLYPPKGQV